MKSTWYIFCEQMFTPIDGKPNQFGVGRVAILAQTPSHGYAMASRLLTQPLLAWYETESMPAGVTIGCNLCGSPWSESTGHVDTDGGQCWCGPCARSMVEMVRDTVRRRRRGINFYDHAGPIPEKPPPGWEP